MNKNSKIIAIVLVVIAIIIIVSISLNGRSDNATPGTSDTSDTTTTTASSTTPIGVSETKKVSSTLSEYHNAELGFSLKYPSDWEKIESNAGVTFAIPIDKSQTSTVATLQVAVQVLSGKCAFPPITTIKDRSTVKAGGNTFNMVSISNSVNGIAYFNRLYSLQQGSVCYMFSSAAVTLNPATTKGLTGSNIAVAQNNNKAIVNSADSAFTDMVKSFTFVAGPQGQDESQVSPKK